MSALGQKRTFTRLWPMSALPPKADMVRHGGCGVQTGTSGGKVTGYFVRNF